MGYSADHIPISIWRDADCCLDEWAAPDSISNGTVFAGIDANGNGLFDEGEQPFPIELAE